MWRVIVRVSIRTARKVVRAIRRRDMYRLRVEANMPLPTGDEIISGETMIAVPGTRRAGSFRALLQRVSEACIGASDTESDDDFVQDVIGNEISVRNDTIVGEQANLPRTSRIWSVISGIDSASMSAIAHAPTIIGLAHKFVQPNFWSRRLGCR